MDRNRESNKIKNIWHAMRKILCRSWLIIYIIRQTCRKLNHILGAAIRNDNDTSTLLGTYVYYCDKTRPRYRYINSYERTRYIIVYLSMDTCQKLPFHNEQVILDRVEFAFLVIYIHRCPNSAHNTLCVLYRIILYYTTISAGKRRRGCAAAGASI